MELPTISLRIIGQPVAKGRPRAVPIMVRGRPVLDERGWPVITVYTPTKTKQWKKDIIKQVKTKAPSKPWVGAIRCDREYIMPRPKCHKNTRYHTKKPDIDNLDKALFDALDKIFFIGDQQICAGIHTKRYVNPGEEPGVIAKFTLLED